MPARTHVFTGSIYEELAGYARAVIVGDQIYVSGTVGVDFNTGEMPESAEDQASIVLDTIESTLKKADATLGDIVRARVYIPDPQHIEAVSGVLKKRVGFTYPANTTVCTPLAVPGAHVEIEVEAIRGSAAH